MNKIMLSAVLIFSSVFASGCNSAKPLTAFYPTPVITSFSLVNEKPEFNKRRLGTQLIRTNSLTEQKKNQTKLHTYYFKHYSSGADNYPVGSTNEHMKMLTKAEKEIGVQAKLDSNADGKIKLTELLAFVTSNDYIKYFRDSFILFSFGKLDKNGDKKLNMDEFGQFNKIIKAKELPDFQLLEKFADYDYNSSRDLDLEEYEDFFMEYLLLKIGVTK